MSFAPDSLLNTCRITLPHHNLESSVPRTRTEPSETRPTGSGLSETRTHVFQVSARYFISSPSPRYIYEQTLMTTWNPPGPGPLDLGMTLRGTCEVTFLVSWQSRRLLLRFLWSPSYRAVVTKMHPLEIGTCAGGPSSNRIEAGGT